MLFSVVFGVPEKSVFTRLFELFATAMLANFQDRLVMTASICFRTEVLYHSPSILSSPQKEKGRDLHDKSAFLARGAQDISAGQGEGDEDGQGGSQDAVGDQYHAADGAESGAVGVPIVGSTEEACEGGYGGGDIGAEEHPAEGETAPPHDDVKACQGGAGRAGGVVIGPKGGDEEAGEGDGQADVFFGSWGERDHGALRISISIGWFHRETVCFFSRVRRIFSASFFTKSGVQSFCQYSKIVTDKG